MMNNVGKTTDTVSWKLPSLRGITWRSNRTSMKSFDYNPLMLNNYFWLLVHYLFGHILYHYPCILRCSSSLNKWNRSWDPSMIREFSNSITCMILSLDFVTQLIVDFIDLGTLLVPYFQAVFKIKTPPSTAQGQPYYNNMLKDRLSTDQIIVTFP